MCCVFYSFVRRGFDLLSLVECVFAERQFPYIIQNGFNRYILSYSLLKAGRTDVYHCAWLKNTLFY